MVGPYFQVTALVNGKPLQFLVDTGAGLTALTPEGAKLAGITGGMPVQAGGAGGKSIPAKLAKAASVQVGQSVVKDEQVVVVELPPALRCHGLVGYSFLKHFVTSFDYTAPALTFASPADFKPHSDDREAELTLRSNHPHIKGSVAGQEGLFVFDTGSGAMVTLHSPFVEANQLRTKFPPRLSRITGKGVGGYVQGDLTTLPELSIAGFTLKSVPTAMAAAGSGAMSDNGSFGNIGADVIRRFILTLDYANKKAYFRKSRQFDDPFWVDRSGVFVDFDEKHTWIAEVVPGSPADQTGVKLNDEVLSINGVKVSEGHPLEIRKPLRAPAGSRVSMELKRDGKVFTVVFELRDM